jgi:hypothetical protein
MTRGLPGWDMVFDPRTLAMTSCLGWSQDDLLKTRMDLTRRAAQVGGKSGDFWWSFPGPRHRVRAFPA